MQDYRGRITRKQLLFGLTLAPFAVIGCGKKSAPEGNATEISQFFAAVDDGDADVVARLLRAKPYLANAKNESGETALSIAKKKGNEELVDALKKGGAH